MDSPLSSSFLLFLLTITILVIFPTALCVDDIRYTNCSKEFLCGGIRSIKYPFWGANRASYCGKPGYELDCFNNSTPLLTMMSEKYRILGIDYQEHSLTVARQDLWNNICPVIFVNTTLDYTLFNYASGLRNLSLFYGCSALPGPDIQFSAQYNCTINNTDTNLFYATMDITIDPAIARCNSSFVVPVFEKLAQDLEANSTSLVAALDGGFQLQWDVESDQCKNCTESGGACGYNLTDSQFTCFCHDRSYLNTCPSRRGSDSSNRTTLNIVLPVVGAILAGIGIGWLFFFCRQRRKKRAVKSAQAENKDLPTPLSSKRHTTTNPSTNFTQSIPSYPSTTSDFAKSNYFGVQVFTYAELERATDNFDSSKELGDGGFGTVYYGKLVDGREVAVKHLYDNNFKRLEQFINEVEILARLHHKNLVKLYGCTSKRSRELLLVYEYISNGTVADHLHGKRTNSVSGLLSWPVRLNIAIETAGALAYLHESDIIHRDVKTNNILLDNDFCVKVADFGLSRLFPNDATHVSTAPQGTPGYVDPEYYQCYQLTDKSDVYSFGVVLIELISSLEAVDTNRHRHHINLANMGIDKIQNHKLHELVDKTFGFETDNTVRKMTTLVAELAFRCLQQDKDMRPTMKEVLEILRGIQNEQWNGQKPEVLDIVVDNGAILKDNASPSSPDSSVTDRLVGSTPNSSC